MRIETPGDRFAQLEVHAWLTPIDDKEEAIAGEHVPTTSSLRAMLTPSSRDEDRRPQ